MNRYLMNRPAAGTIRIVTPHGTFTIPEARFDVIHRSGWPDSVPSQTVEVAGPTAHFRPHWRHRWAHGLRNAERNERVSRPMERVTRVAYRRAGVFGLEFMTQFNDQGEDTNWRLRLDLPFLGELPLSIDVRLAGDAGIPIAAGDGPESDAYARLAHRLIAGGMA